jgi:chromosomal replication initiator protein
VVINFATNVELLRTIAEAEGVTLPEDVAVFLANQLDATQIAATLSRLIAFASLTRQDITLPFAEEALKYMKNLR